MPISKAEFKKAFREVVSSEFSHIPKNENEIEYEFSERFNKRMAKLINSQKKSYYRLINTAAKRVAVIFILVLTMFTAAFSVKAIREPIIEFVKHVYETFIHYSVEGDTDDKIEIEYSLTFVPDGFEQTDIIRNDNSINITYESTDGDIIEFSQMTTNYNFEHLLDNETGESFSETVDGIKVDFKEWHDTKTAIWTNYGYVFLIDCIGDIGFDEIKQMLVSLE